MFLFSRTKPGRLTMDGLVKWIGAGSGGSLQSNNLFTKATDFRVCKNPNNFKITFIFDTKIKMLTPLAQFPTITFKIATDSVSKIVFHF